MIGEFSVGVEEEYQLVQPETGELCSGATGVLAADWAGDLKPEVQLSQIEIGTEICHSAREVADELARLRMQAATAAASEGLAIVAAAMHPFARWEEHGPSPGERYDRIRARFGRIVKSEHIYGMHVHVGVPRGLERARIMNRARWFLPHLLALSASSPIYEGEDTGFASYRTVQARRLSHSGPPPEFPSDAEYTRFLKLLAQAGSLEDEYTVYWSIRLHPEYPTVEFRNTDVCPRLEDAASIAAFIRALAVGVIEGVLPDPPGTSLPVTERDALLSANEWSVARYGLDARLAFPEREGAHEPVRDAIRRLRDVIAPLAEALGDAEALEGIERIVTRGNAADRIRALYTEGASGCELVKALMAETLKDTGLERQHRAARGDDVAWRGGPAAAASRPAGAAVEGP